MRFLKTLEEELLTKMERLSGDMYNTTVTLPTGVADLPHQYTQSASV